MRKYNGKYIVICLACSEIVGKWDANTDSLTCKEVCECGCDDFYHEDEITFNERISGGLDHDV